MDIIVEIGTDRLRPVFQHSGKAEFSESMRHEYHSHPVHHVLLMTEGSTVFRLDDRLENIHAGHLVLIPPYMKHQFTPAGYSFGYYELTFQLINERKEYDLRPLPRVLESLYPLSVPEDNVVTPHSKQSFLILEQMFERFLAGITDTSPGARTELQFAIIGFLLQLSKYLSEWNQDKGECSHAEYIKTILCEQYSRPHRLEDLAKLVGLHPNYLCSVFKEETGQTLFAYLNDVRIREAKRLLEFTDLSISQIAEEIGMSSHSYFSRQFKLTTGLTPRQYRARVMQFDSTPRSLT
jgi:AraC-like DNA-binding protein